MEYGAANRPRYPGAVTGAPVAAYAGQAGGRCAAPEPCSAAPRPPRSTSPGLSWRQASAYSFLHRLFDAIQFPDTIPHPRRACQPPAPCPRLRPAAAAARRARPEPGESAVVFGAGTIGIAAAIALWEFGLRQVLICDHSDFRLGKAAALGFAVCNNARQDLRKAAIDTFGTAHALDGATGDVDIYIDAAGAPEFLDAYFSTGKIESRMVAVAVAAGKRPVDILHMTYAQQALIGSGGYMPEDVSMVMAIMASGRWDVASLITHEYPWEQLPQAIEMAARPQEALNVIVRYDAAGRE